MKLRHIALVYSTEEKADRFLIGALGLRKAQPKILAADMSRAIFGHEGELQVINYTNEDLHFEVFIDSGHWGKTNPIEHVLLEVANLTVFLEGCRRAKATIRTIPRKDSVLIFVADEENHLFEIKEQKVGT